MPWQVGASRRPGQPDAWDLRGSFSTSPEVRTCLLMTLTYHRTVGLHIWLSNQENVSMRSLHNAERSRCVSIRVHLPQRILALPCPTAQIFILLPLLLMLLLSNMLPCSMNWLLQFRVPISFFIWPMLIFLKLKIIKSCSNGVISMTYTSGFEIAS